MRKKRKHPSPLSVITFCLLLLFSCSSGSRGPTDSTEAAESLDLVEPSEMVEISEIDFTLLEEGFKSISSERDSMLNIISYISRYNPNGLGAIEITLSNGAIYLANDLNESKFSTLLHLLNTEGLLFDPVSEEFVLKG